MVTGPVGIAGGKLDENELKVGSVTEVVKLEELAEFDMLDTEVTDPVSVMELDIPNTEVTDPVTAFELDTPDPELTDPVRLIGPEALVKLNVDTLDTARLEVDERAMDDDKLLLLLQGKALQPGVYLDAS